MPHSTSTPSPAALAALPPPPTGDFCDAFGVRCYRMAGVENLPPFLINLVSASNLWMFVASNGALTAGRVDADGALFPYQTVDRIYDSAGQIGPVTALWVTTPAGEVLWEPFALHTQRLHGVTRNLYKSVEGDRLWFEEINHGLGLAFRYGWATAEPFGFVRRCELINRGAHAVSVRICDGLRNLLPAGVPQRTQGSSSNLADAYKTAELLTDSTLAVYALAAKIVDQPTPIESLRASAVWSGGLPGGVVGLSDVTLDNFFAGRPAAGETHRRGVRTSYFLTAELALSVAQSEAWFMVADTGISQAEVLHRHKLAKDPSVEQSLTTAITAATNRLRLLIAGADGLQAGGDEIVSAHHFANVLFNVLRGGTFAEGYTVPAADFVRHVTSHNRAAAARHATLLRDLPERLSRAELFSRVWPLPDPDLRRLAREYLPVMFSRRHGDPSRPWNRFSIRLRDAAGNRLLAYEGNWRDIFQNWEALCLSYPGYFDAIVAKFLSASTADGYNPYRISQAGIDWEAPDPEDPWASIGYWGDHQVIYLLKLLEWAAKFQPAAMPTALRESGYSYAEVPYRIADYAAMRSDPRSTITFDQKSHHAIMGRIPTVGADARLRMNANGQVLHVNLTEKLLVLVLVRLTNFIPGGGIWMNTQRPEWNDANNALVGYGVSVVTLCYLRRFLAHCRATLWPKLGSDRVAVSEAVATLLRQVHAILGLHQTALTRPDYSPTERRDLVDALAAAGSEYRQRIYTAGPGSCTQVMPTDIVALFDRAQAFVDHSVHANLRPDGLFHAYNQLEFTESPSGLVVHHLPLMLEGQVAGLSSGLLQPAEVVTLLDALRNSALHRPDQHSYTLYPDRTLPGFLERNIISAPAWQTCRLLGEMLAAGDHRLVLQDAKGHYRFHADLVSDAALEQRLAECARDPRWAEAITAHGAEVRAVYEQVFRHRAFTGRSGSMFGFEGLGCIYWHMVAKLLLAVQEIITTVQSVGAPETARLIELYYEVRAGLGFNKTPGEYGAFPTDPYSHTPGHSGAQQPGMTGQVKEEILTRLGELGLSVNQGCITFAPTLLRAGEFTARATPFRYFVAEGKEARLTLPAGALAFTFCGIPVVYRRSERAAQIALHAATGTVQQVPGKRLDAETSARWFDRDGTIARVEVELGPDYQPL
ncbi:MAG: hypothetical protein K9N01_01065 [Cephaloticoccus sp.]|nr:hypothetical protein [Cephaloticoccus sp.]